MNIYACIAILFLSLSAKAQVDLSYFDLNPEQIKIIRKLESKGTVADEILLKLAKASVTHNLKKEEYVPEYTLKELELIRSWAVGLAFNSYAKDANLIFDYKAYMSSYPVLRDGEPYMALFNIAIATGTEFLSIDVLHFSLNIQSALAQKKAKLSDQEFYYYYLDLVKKYKFDRFISDAYETEVA